MVWIQWLILNVYVYNTVYNNTLMLSEAAVTMVTEVIRSLVSFLQME